LAALHSQMRDLGHAWLAVWAVSQALQIAAPEGHLTEACTTTRG